MEKKIPGKTDEDVIQEILQGGRAREKAVRELYEEYFHLIFHFSGKYKIMDTETLRDVYSDAIVHFENLVIEGKYKNINKDIRSLIHVIIDLEVKRYKNLRDKLVHTIDNFEELTENIEASESDYVPSLQEKFENEFGIKLSIDPGTAPPEEIAYFLTLLSILYKKYGGSGIKFMPDAIPQKVKEVAS